MGVDIYIYCPIGQPGAARGELGFDLEELLGAAGEITGGGSGVQGFNIDLELNDDEDLEQWITRLRDFLRQQGARPGTYFTIYPPGWHPNIARRRVEVYDK